MFILIACSFWTGVHWMKDVVTDAAANLIPMSAEEGATLSSSKPDFQQNYSETVIDMEAAEDRNDKALDKLFVEFLGQLDEDQTTTISEKLISVDCCVDADELQKMDHS